jgi:hypothetical protein
LQGGQGGRNGGRLDDASRSGFAPERAQERVAVRLEHQEVAGGAALEAVDHCSPIGVSSRLCRAPGPGRLI